MKNLILIILISIVPIFSSGDKHGTSTGKGNLEFDFTWNPFNLIKSGESVFFINYGLTNRLDFHAYLTNHIHNRENYYFGLSYQFADTKYLDLATAIGYRQNLTNWKRNRGDQLFFPQLSYTIKFYKDFAVGGAFLNMLQQNNNNKFEYIRTAFDIALHVPISRIVKLPKYMPEMKLALGLHNRNIFDPDRSFLPTYSVDVTFKNFSIKNIVENILN